MSSLLKPPVSVLAMKRCSVRSAKIGINAEPIWRCTPSLTACSRLRLSLNSSDARAASADITKPKRLASSIMAVMPSRPWLSIGIMSRPFLPKSFTANAAFSALSGMAENLSARSSKTSSVGRIWLCASTAEMPNARNAALPSPPLTFASNMAVDKNFKALVKLSVLTSDNSDAYSNADKASTDTAVFWDSLLSSSPTSATGTISWCIP